jgi:NAD(P)-dependent dehydrogenase (short-subunit alcohol dehydrogenase family)
LFEKGANVIVVSPSSSCEKLASSLHAPAPVPAPATTAPATTATATTATGAPHTEAGGTQKQSTSEKLLSKLNKVLSLGDDKDDAAGSAANKAVAIRADLSSASAAAELAKKAVSTAKSEFKNAHGHGHEGKIDYVILCGGIMPMATLEKVDEKQWNHIFGVNVIGPVFLAKVSASLVEDYTRWTDLFLRSSQAISQMKERSSSSLPV